MEKFPELDQADTRGSRWDLRNLGYALLEKWWVIATCLALSIGLGLVYLARAQTLYAATAVIQFDPDRPRILNAQEQLVQETRSDDERKEKRKEIQVILKSPPLLGRVIEANELSTNPRFLSLLGTNKISPSALIPVLGRAVRSELRPGTTFMDVTVELADPALAATLANSFVRELIRLDSDTYKAASRFAIDFLGEEARELKRKLYESEAKLQDYRDQSLSLEQRQAIVADNLRELNQKVNEAKAERIREESEYFPVRDLGNNISQLLNVPRIAADPTVVAMRSTLAQQEVAFANARQIYRPRHPTYIQAQSSVQDAYQALSNAVLKAVQLMRVSLANAADREKALVEELTRQEQLAQQLNSQVLPYNTLLRDIEQYRALYDALVKRMGEAEIAGNLSRRTIQIFQEATTPRSPVKPRRVLVAAASVAGGLGVGLLLVLAWSAFDDSFQTVIDVEEGLSLPVLTTVPRIAPRKVRRQPIVMTHGPHSSAEAFRALRTSLFLQDPAGQQRVLLFTSTLPGEGKTFCSVNCAVSLAQQGYRTLLIDGDLRRPMLEEMLLGKRQNIPGLSDFLAGDAVTVRETTLPNLSLLPAGRVVPNPSELLARAGLQGLLAEIGPHFDRIVIDSAPIFGVSDTLRLVPDVQVVCLVVQAARTPRRQVLRCLQMLQRAGAANIGVVLNGVSGSRRVAYDSPYHDYGYDRLPRKGGGPGTAFLPAQEIKISEPTLPTRSRPGRS